MHANNWTLFTEKPNIYPYPSLQFCACKLFLTYVVKFYFQLLSIRHIAAVAANEMLTKFLTTGQPHFKV